MKNAADSAAASTLQWEIKAYLSLCESINSPRSLTCHQLASNGEWGQLLELKWFPDDQNVEHSALDYLVSSIMKKNPRIPLGVDTKQVAIQKFLDCEVAVKDTNHRILGGRFLSDAPPDVRETILRARRLIKRWLGPLSTADLDYVWRKCRFGPGSTSHVSGSDVSSSRKYSALGATPRLSSFLKKLLPTAWWMGAGTMEIPSCWYSKVTTVSKSALTDRPICIEPHLNIWVQLGIGALIRRQLRRIGLDLDTQADTNRWLASLAQAWGLATIDLESASDTIARELVRLLLPARWVHLLELARTDCAQLPDGTIIGLEKWSSMGNGYTFELESLIFYALSMAASRCKAHTATFGDDIIVPQSCTTQLLGTLEYCGFRVNRSKTFLAGAFFESCGTDWLSGVDVRPFYFKSEVDSMEDAIDASLKACNRIRLYAHDLARSSGRHACDRRLLPAWLRVHSSVPREWRECRIPMAYGDDRGIVSNFDEAVPSYDKHFGTYGFRCRTRRALTTDIASELGYVLSYTRTSQKWASRFTVNHSAGRWSIGDYLESDPTTSITTCRKTGKIRIRREPLQTDLRQLKGKGQHARGSTQSWPSLGPWA